MDDIDEKGHPESLFTLTMRRLRDGVFQPGDPVRGSWDSATVLRVEGHGPQADVLIEWDPVDAAGQTLGAGRTTWRKAWTLRHLSGADIGSEGGSDVTP